MTDLQIALTILISITFVGHCLCAAYIYKLCKKDNKAPAPWLCAAVCTGLVALAYYHMQSNQKK